MHCTATLRRPSGLWAKWPKPEEDFVLKLDNLKCLLCASSSKNLVQDVHTSLPPLFHDASGSPWDSHASDVCRDMWLCAVVRYGSETGSTRSGTDSQVTPQSAT